MTYSEFNHWNCTRSVGKEYVKCKLRHVWRSKTTNEFYYYNLDTFTHGSSTIPKLTIVNLLCICTYYTHFIINIVESFHNNKEGTLNFCLIFSAIVNPRSCMAVNQQ